MTELQEAREAIAKIVHDFYFIPTAYTGSTEAADAILALKDAEGHPLLAVLAKDQTPPAIPDFQYDKTEDRPLLKRGAINYSKMLGGWKRVVNAD